MLFTISMISHENKNADSIILIYDLGLNLLEEHIELDLIRTCRTFEANEISMLSFKSIGINYHQILALKVSASDATFCIAFEKKLSLIP